MLQYSKYFHVVKYVWVNCKAIQVSQELILQILISTKLFSIKFNVGAAESRRAKASFDIFRFVSQEFG